MAKRKKTPRSAGRVRSLDGGRRRAAAREAAAQPRGGGDGQEQVRERVERLIGGGGGFSIVGVGASAGGLEAFRQFLNALPADTGMAIILVQHLSPKHESVLPELLAGATMMPVVQVSEGMGIEPNYVYVMPPNVHMGVNAEGRFHLTPRPQDRTQHNPIDTFLQSLAHYAEGRTIGVVLSGTATDGAAGMREVKAAGGITLAQEPKSAKYDGMPRAAIATGAVDLVLPPHEIAAELLQISRHPLLRRVQVRHDGEELEVMDGQLQRIFVILRNATGVDFANYKQPTIRRRLHRRMVLHKIGTIDRYIKFLQETPEEVQALYADILIHVTRFFREPESFKALAEIVFPVVSKSRQETGTREGAIRVWTPGCASGEEAYSVAIALLEYLGENVGGVPIQIFATDISETAIEFARAGVYPESIADDVSPERLRRFFTRADGSYRINKQVRDLCVFARQDVTRDPPFSRLDLIVCRNVLIYLGAALQKRLMGMFHYALKPTGYLLLGSAETVGASGDLFAVADKKQRLYVRKNSFPRMDITFAPSEVNVVREERAGRGGQMGRATNTVQADANRLILERYSPPAVIVDSELQIVQIRGHTGLFLEPAPGDASLSVLKMAREGLLYGMRSALSEARRSGKPVRRGRMRVKHDGQLRDVGLEVFPLEAPGGDRHFLVLFQDETARVPPSEKRKDDGKDMVKSRKDDSKTMRLQQELAASRDYLQSIIQDLEAANEELQSANEEILSSNEELQSTNEELDTAKEELQSTNEELNTVNEELHGRNEELSRVNSDLLNLLASVQVAIVMVSRDLRIRRFTPMAEKVLNLIPGDIGRPISDIKPNFDIPDIERLIAEAIDGVNTVEREVRDRSGSEYALRIRPYKNLENKIDGAVLALFDETTRRHEMEARQARELCEAILETLDEPMAVLDGQGRLVRQNAAFSQRFTDGAVMGQTIYEAVGDRMDKSRLRALIEEALPREGWVEEFDLGKGQDDRPIRATARRVPRGDPEAAAILLAVRG